MKQLIFISIFIVGLNVFFPQNTFGQDRSHTESVETVLQELLTKQQVDTIQKLDCEKVNDDDLERLGDAIMEQQHPGQAHEIMDQMMGGEGSESLQQIHIAMGSNYLGCGEGSGFGTGGGRGMMGFGSMMGYGGFSNAHGLLAGTTWIALIIFLVAGAYFFIKQAGKK
jgi:hypothetical protein